MSDETRDIITGRLTKDPVIKDKVTFLNIGKNIKLQNGDYGKTLWVRIICFKNAKLAADEMRKGDIIRAHGELYCGEDFTKTTTGEVVKGEAEFKCFKLEKVERQSRQRNEFDDAGGEPAPAPRRAAAPAPEPKRDMPPIEDEDFPF